MSREGTQKELDLWLRTGRADRVEECRQRLAHYNQEGEYNGPPVSPSLIARTELSLTTQLQVQEEFLAILKEDDPRRKEVKDKIAAIKEDLITVKLQRLNLLKEQMNKLSQEVLGLNADTGKKG